MASRSILLLDKEDNNALQNNNSEGVPVTYTDSLTYIKNNYTLTSTYLVTSG